MRSSPSPDLCLSALKAIVQGLRGFEDEDEEEEEEEGEEGAVVEDIDADYLEGGRIANAAGAVTAATEGLVVMGHLVEGQQQDQITKQGSYPHPPPSSSPRKALMAVSPAVLPPPVATVKLEDLQPVFVPDRAGVLHASSFLTVDDAPWISGDCD